MRINGRNRIKQDFYVSDVKFKELERKNRKNANELVKNLTT